MTLSAGGPEDLGRIFFFAEFATAVAGWALGINPFDQPNVQEAKDATARVLEAIGEGGALTEPDDADDDALRALLACEPPAYVALLGYIAPCVRGRRAPSPSCARRSAPRRRRRRRSATARATCTRPASSTRAARRTGRFLVLVHDGAEDVAIPSRPFGFRALKNAQAFGDLATLRAHDLPAEKLRLDGASTRPTRSTS